MLALAIISAVAGAITTAGMFLAWSIRYARGEEHRFTQLEGKAEANGKAIDGLVEESRADAERTQDFTNFVREKFSELERRIDRFENNVKRR